MALHDFPLPPELATDDPPLTDDDLAVYFDEDEWVADGSPRAAAADAVNRWRVESDEEAEWAGRKLAVANDELKRLGAQAQEWANRIQDWFVQAARQHHRTAEFMTERLEDYGLRVREAGGPATIELPSVVIKTSDRKPAVEVADDAALAAFLLTAGVENSSWRDALDALPDDAELVKIAPKVYVGPLRKLVTVGIVDDGYDVSVHLVCGHRQEFVVGIVDDLSIPDRGEIIECRECPADPIEGAARVPVELVVLEKRNRLAAVGPDGEEVPGTAVRPGEIVPKVEAR